MFLVQSLVLAIHMQHNVQLRQICRMLKSFEQLQMLYFQEQTNTNFSAITGIYKVICLAKIRADPLGFTCHLISPRLNAEAEKCKSKFIEAKLHLSVHSV